MTEEEGEGGELTLNTDIFCDPLSTIDNDETFLKEFLENLERMFHRFL